MLDAEAEQAAEEHLSEYTTQTADAQPKPAARKPVVTGKALGTGRRKEAIARVRIQPGTGQWKINDRSLEEYFPNKVHQQLISEPLVTLGADEQFDVIARIDGGGVSGQAGALRLGIARALILVDPDSRADAEARRVPDQGCPGHRTQEGRPEEGPQGSAVLQALTAARRRHRGSGGMGQLFGTDGVRGVAGRELDRGPGACGYSRQRCRPACLLRIRRHSRARAAHTGGRSRWSAGTRGLRGVPRGRRGSRAGRQRRRCGAARGHADARRGLPDRRTGRRIRRHAVGEPQSGAGQRDQVLRSGRREAARRGRGRDRGAACRPARHGAGGSACRCHGGEVQSRSGRAGRRARGRVRPGTRRRRTRASAISLTCSAPCQ